MKIKRLPKLDFNSRLERDFSHLIRQARIECGLSQEELAKLLGYKSPVMICLIENNKRRLSAGKLWQISEITNVGMKYFC